MTMSFNNHIKIIFYPSIILKVKWIWMFYIFQSLANYCTCNTLKKVYRLKSKFSIVLSWITTSISCNFICTVTALREQLNNIFLIIGSNNIGLILATEIMLILCSRIVDWIPAIQMKPFCLHDLLSFNQY